MNGFDFRDKYVDIDEDKENSTEIIDDDGSLELDFDEEIGEEDFDTRSKQEKKSNKRGVIIAIGVVVIISCVFLFGYNLYRSSKIPQIDSVHIESDNPENPSIAKYGNMVTLTFSFKTPLVNKPSVRINDRRVEVYGKGKNYYAKYFVQLQGREEINIAFSIYDYQNTKNKKALPITETTDGSSVVIPPYK